MASNKSQEVVKNEKEQIESTFKKEKFINNAKALGYERYVVAGALFDIEKDELTKSEFAIIMKKFLGKKVK